MKYLSISLLLVTTASLASPLEECYNKGESTLIQQCMHEKVVIIKNEYRKERAKFINAIRHQFDDGEAKAARKYEALSNKKWLEFIEYQCNLEATAVSELYSHAYYIQYGACIFNMHDERINLFHKIVSQ